VSDTGKAFWKLADELDTARTRFFAASKSNEKKVAANVAAVRRAQIAELDATSDGSESPVLSTGKSKRWKKIKEAAKKKINEKKAAAADAAEAGEEDVEKVLFATEAAFLHTSLDYTFKINMVLKQERSQIVEALLAYMSAQATFCAQGSDAMKDLQPAVRQLTQQVATEGATTRAARRRMEDEQARSPFDCPPISLVVLLLVAAI
jgi:flagellar motor protein MotB